MSASPPPGPPYPNWPLDRWKLIVLSILFVILILSALAWGRQPVAMEPTAPRGAVAPAPAATVPPPVDLALTLANVAPNMVAEVAAVQVLSGTAAAGSRVEVRHIRLADETAAAVQTLLAGAQSLGITQADADGLWSLAPAEPLAAGQHLIVAQQRDDRGEVVTETPTLVLTLVEAVAAEPAAAPVDPMAVAAPQILEPAVAQRLASIDVHFRGRGLAGSRAQLFVNERFVGDGTVAADGGWEIEPSTPLPAGSYVGRVALLNPFGRITAESASTAFVIEGNGEGSTPPVFWEAPLVPLQVTAWPPAAAAGAGCSGSLAGLATPSSSVIVLADGQPLVAANVQRDRGWQLALPAGLTTDCSALSVVNNLGEAVALAPFYAAASQPVDAAAFQPVFVTPQNGETLTTRRPLLRGVARPASPVSLVVNDRLVATVQADPNGQWAYQMQSDLTGDEAVLEAYVAADDGSVLAASAPVVVGLGE